MTVIERLCITALIDDTAGGRGTLAEHGLAFWIEADGHRVLFDTGQGMVLEHNARQLGIDLWTVGSIVISHGHYDHTGGLANGPEWARGMALYVHPDAFRPKFALNDAGGGRPASAAIRDIEGVRTYVAGVVPTRGATQVARGIWVTGEIPRRNDFEDTGEPFCLDEACTIADEMVDDQALYIESREGIVVVLGCTHAGLANTLDYVAELSGRDRIHAVFGGMHLLKASEERLSRSLAVLERYDVRRIGPSHCTGLRAVGAIMTRWPERFVHMRVGTRVVLGEGAADSSL